MPEVLDHPLVAAERDRLVAAGRAVCVYEDGCGGRNAAVAAGALLARAAGTELYLVETVVLHTRMTVVAEQAAPGVAVRVISPQRLARHPHACDEARVLVAGAGAVAPTGASGRALREALARAPKALLSLHPRELPAAAPLVQAVTGQPDAPLTLARRDLLPPMTWTVNAPASPGTEPGV